MYGASFGVSCDASKLRSGYSSRKRRRSEGCDADSSCSDSEESASDSCSSSDDGEVTSKLGTTKARPVSRSASSPALLSSAPQAPAKKLVLPFHTVVIGNAKAWTEVQKSVKAGLSVFIHGPTGIGKSMGTKLLRDRLFPNGMGPHEFAESEDVSYLHSYNKTQGNKPGCGVLVDDPDTLSPKMQRALIHFLQCIPVPSIQYPGSPGYWPMPIIVTGNDAWSSFMRDARRHFQNIVRMWPVKSYLIQKHVCKTLKITSGAIKSLNFSHGDVRQALISARLGLRNDASGKHKKLLKCSGCSSSDRAPTAFDDARCIMDGTYGIKGAPKVLPGDALSIVYASHLSCTRSLEDAAAAAEALSVSDLFLHDVDGTSELVCGAFSSATRRPSSSMRLQKSVPVASGPNARAKMRLRLNNVHMALNQLQQQRCMSSLAVPMRRPTPGLARSEVKLLLAQNRGLRSAFDKSQVRAMSKDLHDICRSFSK